MLEEKHCRVAWGIKVLLAVTAQGVVGMEGTARRELPGEMAAQERLGRMQAC